MTFERCPQRHGECPGIYARCECGWYAEYPNERSARYYAALHGDECE